ncbi:MAG: hypothetical protein ACJ8GJ_20485, partial [Vitreoscilla sp.]
MRQRLAGLAMALAACVGAEARAAVPDAPPPRDSAAPAPPSPAVPSTPAPGPAPASGPSHLPDCSRPLSLGL